MVRHRYTRLGHTSGAVNEAAAWWARRLAEKVVLHARAVCKRFAESCKAAKMMYRIIAAAGVPGQAAVVHRGGRQIILYVAPFWSYNKTDC